VNLVFLLLSIQSIRPTYFGKTINDWFQFILIAEILYFLNLVYFLSLVGLWQNHLLYWPLTNFMWRNRTPFGKWVVNKYGSECYHFRSFFHGTLHMWARIDEEQWICHRPTKLKKVNQIKKVQYFSFFNVIVLSEKF
jgi:hypothetical protein